MQEAKDLKKLSLDELIGNLQTYELRRNSQQEETKKDRGLALKIMEEDRSELDEEDIAETRQEHLSRSKNTDQN